MAHAATRPSRLANPAPDRTSTRSVLLIDGHLEALSTYEADLQARGYQVEHAMTAHAALGRLAESEPCAVVVDATVPDADALRLCASIRRLGTTDEVPIIFLSAMPIEDIQLHASDLGVTEALQQPVSPEALATSLERYCGPA